MKNKLLVIIGMIVLIVPLMACSESTAPAQSSMASQVTALWTASTTWNAYGPKIQALEEQISKKADSTRVDALMMGGGGGGNSYAKSETYTQDQVNSTVANAIDALKKDQSWIKSSTRTTDAGTTSGEFGELVDTNGDLELWLEKVGGDADSNLLTTSKDYNSRSNFDFVVVNKDSSSSHSFRVTLTFMPQIAVTTGTCAATADNGLTFAAPATRAADSLDDLSFKSNERRVAKSDNESFRVIVNVAQGATTAMVDWDISFDVLDKN
jgi:hypothetical protein